MAERTKERARFYADIIVTAVEGGIGYWAEGRDYKWDVSDPDDTTVTIREEESSECDGPGAWVTITTDTIASAFTRVREGTPVEASDRLGVHESYIRSLRAAYEDVDAADLDAGDCDILVQVAVLGEVIYG